MSSRFVRVGGGLQWHGSRGTVLAVCEFIAGQPGHNAALDRIVGEESRRLFVDHDLLKMDQLSKEQYAEFDEWLRVIQSSPSVSEGWSDEGRRLFDLEVARWRQLLATRISQLT